MIDSSLQDERKREALEKPGEYIFMRGLTFISVGFIREGRVGRGGRHTQKTPHGRPSRGSHPHNEPELAPKPNLLGLVPLQTQPVFLFR